MLKSKVPKVPSRERASVVTPGLTIEFRQISQLKPDPRNARFHPPKHVQQLAKSIAAFGFNVPLLVDAEGGVIAGHGRLLAVQHLGWSEVPSITLEHLTPDQVRAYRIADNRLTDCSTWDERLLAEQLQALAGAELDFDLEAIGFDMPEIDLRIQSLGDIEDEPDGTGAAENADEPIVSALGDVWQLGSHRIACGSALEQATYDALLQGQHAQMVFTQTRPTT